MLLRACCPRRLSTSHRHFLPIRVLRRLNHDEVATRKTEPDAAIYTTDVGIKGVAAPAQGKPSSNGTKVQPKGCSKRKIDPRKETRTGLLPERTKWEGFEDLSMSRYLGLKELAEPPGMTFDTVTQTLAFEKPLDRNSIEYREFNIVPYTKPFVLKAITNRATALAIISNTAKHRDRNLRGGYLVHTHNNPTKILRARIAHTTDFFYSNMCRMIQCAWGRQWFMVDKKLEVERDSSVPDYFDSKDIPRMFFESHLVHEPGSPPERHMSLAWVSINAGVSALSEDWDALSGARDKREEREKEIKKEGDWRRELVTGEEIEEEWTHTDRSMMVKKPLLPVILKTFSKWLRNEWNGRHLNTINKDNDFPVVFAFRDQYLWFVWKGGYDGKMVAQYMSQWVPPHKFQGRMKEAFEKLAWEAKHLEPRVPHPRHTSAPATWNPGNIPGGEGGRQRALKAKEKQKEAALEALREAMMAAAEPDRYPVPESIRRKAENAGWDGRPTGSPAQGRKQKPPKISKNRKYRKTSPIKENDFR